MHRFNAVLLMIVPSVLRAHSFLALEQIVVHIEYHIKSIIEK